MAFKHYRCRENDKDRATEIVVNKKKCGNGSYNVMTISQLDFTRRRLAITAWNWHTRRPVATPCGVSEDCSIICELWWCHYCLSGTASSPPEHTEGRCPIIGPPSRKVSLADNLPPKFRPPSFRPGETDFYR